MTNAHAFQCRYDARTRIAGNFSVGRLIDRMEDLLERLTAESSITN
jgi:hypothetical protein